MKEDGFVPLSNALRRKETQSTIPGLWTAAPFPHSALVSVLPPAHSRQLTTLYSLWCYEPQILYNSPYLKDKEERIQVRIPATCNIQPVSSYWDKQHCVNFKILLSVIWRRAESDQGFIFSESETIKHSSTSPGKFRETVLILCDSTKATVILSVLLQNAEAGPG